MLVMKSIRLIFIPGALASLIAFTAVSPAFRVQDETPPTPPAPPAKKEEAGKKQAPAIKVFVDGEEVNFALEKPQSVAGRTLVPMRPIFEALGATVDYDIVHRRILARRENQEIELTIGEKIARKNGAEITMDVAPTLKKGSTLVPLRFVAESLDAKVNYDNKTQEIRISTDEEPEPPKPVDGGKGDGGSTNG
jgi:hypothetical protein